MAGELYKTYLMSGELYKYCFCLFIRDSDTEYENKQVGHLMRSKTLGVDEGGICAGFATLDTPLLIE